MKAETKILRLLFGLSCLLFLNACSSLGGDSPQGTSAGAQPSPLNLTVQQAQDALRSAETERTRIRQAGNQTQKTSQKELQQLQAAAQTARSQAKAAKKKFDQAVEDTVRLGKNPDDPKESPKTDQARKASQNAESQAQAAEQRYSSASNGSSPTAAELAEVDKKVEQASQELEAAKQREQQAQVAASHNSGNLTRPNEFDPILSILVPFLVTTLPLLVVLGLAYWGLARKLNDRFDSLARRSVELKEKQDQGSGTLNSIVGESKKFGQNVEDLRTRLSEIVTTMEHVNRSLERLGADGQDSDHSTDSDVGEEPLSFPMTAEEYLSRMQGKLLYVTHDYPNNMLLEDSQNGAIALVLDHSAPEGMHYAVPKLSRFPTKQEYYTFYEEYFDCNPPFSGVVSIIKPAIVDSNEGGWKLNERGLLRVG
jgi:hypothetical protein